MILRNLRKLAVDSNILLSAVIGKSALKVFAHADIEFVTTRFNIEEVKEYIPHLAAKYHLQNSILILQLQMLPIKVMDESYYKSHLAEAKKYLAARDLDDIYLGALALKENIPIWTHDKDFKHFPLTVYGTAQLMELFKM